MSADIRMWIEIAVAFLIWFAAGFIFMTARRVGKYVEEIRELKDMADKAHAAREAVMRGLVSDIVTEYHRLHAKNDPTRPLNLQ